LLTSALNGIFALTLGFGLIASVWTPAALAGIAVALYAAFLVAAWFYCGRDIVGCAELCEVPSHARRVFHATLDLLGGTGSNWVRAERTADLAGASIAVDNAAEAEKRPSPAPERGAVPHEREEPLQSNPADRQTRS
jgi:hypothetical protein